MKISVIVPSYNQGRFLPECLGSIVPQLRDGDELLVIDGGSSDESLSVINKYIDYITKFISEKDKGQADAINKGLSWATGDAIVWINSDDALMPDALSRLRMGWGDGLNMLVFDSIWIDEHCQTVSWMPAPRFMHKGLFSDGMMPINQPSCVMPRKTYEELGGIDVRLHYALDYDVITRAVISGIRIKRIVSPFAINRIHDATKTSSGRLPAELHAVATRLFGNSVRPYKANYVRKFGLTGFYQFSPWVIFRYVLKRFDRSVLPGLRISSLEKHVQKWLENCRREEKE